VKGGGTLAKLIAVLVSFLAVATIIACGEEVDPEAFYGYWQETGAGREMQIADDRYHHLRRRQRDDHHHERLQRR
jgi:hypothetical protein